MLFKNHRFIFSFFTVILTIDLSAQEEVDTSKSWLELEAVYSALPWYNIMGGLETGFVYIDNVDLKALINFDEVFDLENNISLFVYGLGNNGGQATGLMGDFQVASNIEAVQAWRLFEVWVQQNFLEDRISILAGLYDLNTEFDVLAPGTLFINSSFGIGAEYAQSGQNGPSIFPISSLGMRITSFMGNRTRVRLAILDGVSGDPDNLKSNKIDISSSDGVLIAGEASIYTGKNFNEDEKVGREYDVYANDKINIGGWYYTSNPATVSTIQQEEKKNVGMYVGVQKYIALNEKDDYVALFARFGFASDQFNRYGSALSGGFIMSNPISDFDDTFGLAFSSGFNGKQFQELQAGSETTETVTELTYSLPV